MSISIVRYVGLDVHKRVVEACIVDADGKVVHRERFVLNRRTLHLFATKVLRPTDHVALEATTNCWAVADALRPHVAGVVVSNPMATKAIALAKVKTDRVDAHVLAQLLRCDFLPEVWQPDEATRRLRELTGRRSALVGQRTDDAQPHPQRVGDAIDRSAGEVVQRRGPGLAGARGTRRARPNAGRQRPAAVGLLAEGDRRARRGIGEARARTAAE